MNESLTTTVRIPNNLDLNLIFTDVKGNKTKIQYLKDGTVYLISLLTVDNYNYVNIKDGYTPLSGKILSEIIGDKRPTEIVKILVGKGVIEIKPHSQGHFSRRYRLTEHYNTGLFTEVELSERIKTKIHQHRQNRQHNHIELSERIKYIQDRQLTELTDKELDKKYSFVFDQFNENDLCIDTENGGLFIRNLGIKLFQKTLLLNKNRGFVLKSVFNYIGRMMNQLEDFNEKKYNLNLYTSNHRFHSTLTSLPKILRPFLKINGNNIGEVDISNSQSYILSTILNQEFTISDEDGYNIHTIYEDLNKDFNSTKYIIPSNKDGNSRYVLGVHMSEDEYNGLNKFTKFDFSTDFYEYILTEGLRLYPQYLKQKKGFSLGRDYIKDNIMNFLFDSYDYRRENNNVIELINRLFPELGYYINRFHQTHGRRELSLLLQRTESYLVLKNVCKRIYDEKPKTPFFTIHDSIITTQSDLEYVKNTMSDTISNITGKPVNVKLKKYSQTTDISDEVFDETWDIVKISSKEKYQKMRSSFLQVNINNGMNLLLTKEEQEEWSEIMKKEIERDL